MDSGSSSAFTNTLVPLGDALMESFSRAESVDMAVSFLMETGLSRVMGALTRALDRGVRVRIVTGTYLGITSPFVLEKFGDVMEVQAASAKKGGWSEEELLAENMRKRGGRGGLDSRILLTL